MAIFLSNMALPMLDASCDLFLILWPLVTSLVSFSSMALPTTDLNNVDCHFPIQHGTPHVGCFQLFVFYFADPLLLPPSTHPPFHSFHTRHAPPRHRLLLFVVAAGFRSLFSGEHLPQAISGTWICLQCTRQQLLAVDESNCIYVSSRHQL